MTISPSNLRIQYAGKDAAAADLTMISSLIHSLWEEVYRTLYFLSIRNVYRFRTPSPDLAKTWVQYLSYAVRGLNVQSLPDDLIDLRT